jgi:alkylhydroperoxidase family enzyme
VKPMRWVAMRYARIRFGKVPEPMQAWAQHGGVFWAFSAEETILEWTFHTAPKRLQYLAVLKAASVVDCPWCLDFGSHISLHRGLSEEKVRDLHEWRTSSAYDDDERLVLAYAEDLSASPVVIDDTLTDKLRERLGDKALVELTALVAIENQRSRFNKAMGVMPQGWSRVCALPTHPTQEHAVSTA